MANTTVIGGAELLRKFGELEALARPQLLDNAAVAGALPILNDAIQHAPVLTGTLRRSLHISGHTDKTPGFEGKGLTREAYNTGKVILRIGTDVVYAARQEFGYSDTDSLGRSYHQPARPYLRPAFDERQSEAIKEMEAALAQMLDSLVK